jgi:hypothetical protein
MALRRTAMSDPSYVPVLKGKDGEFKALYCLAPSVKRKVIPFIDIPRIDIDPKNKRPKYTIDEHLTKKAQSILKAWGTEQPLFVDLFDLSLDLRTADGNHILDFLFSKLREMEVNAIPVIGFDRSGDFEYVRATSNTIAVDGRGLCLRLLREDMEDPKRAYDSMNDLLEMLNLPEEKVHLLMDFRDISEETLPDITEISARFLSNLPEHGSWKTLALVCSAFPENLKDVQPRSTARLPRSEWQLRKGLALLRKKIPRFPMFGDYGICHPDLPDFNPQYTPSAAIRYTTSEDWLIVKAGSIKKDTYQQFRQLCGILRNRPEYSGTQYSWGDSFINDCADFNTTGPGNLTTWRQVGTNHHITFVSNQISSSRAS